MTLFLLQIVGANPPHAVVRLPAGGALERDLIADGSEAAMKYMDKLLEVFVGTVIAKGVGVGRTEAHVEMDLRDAIHEWRVDMKDAIARGLTDMVAELKNETRQVIT